MPSRIYGFLSTQHPTRRAHLIGIAHQYIKNDQLVNLIQNIDINNMKRSAHLANQFRLFEEVPGLKHQVTDWIGS